MFERAEQTHTTAIWTLVAGFIGGSLLGVYFASLNTTTAGSILLAVGTYITILTSTFSLKSNPFGVLLIFVTSFGTVIGLIYVSRITLEYFNESPFQIVLVYAAVFALVAELIYLWSRLTWVEDTRMHQLIEIGRDDSGGTGELYDLRGNSENSVLSFFGWITEIISFTIFRMYFSLRGEKASAMKYPILIIESMSKWSGAEKARKVTIKNETLKKVKICVYHRNDYCCWLPVGGLTGGMHELDRNEEVVISPHWPAAAFRVKVFAHGVIDYELACHPCVVRGRKYAFIDVGKPITLVSFSSPVSSAIRSPATEMDLDGISVSSDESETTFINAFEKDSSGLTAGASSGGLRRVSSSRANLCLAMSPAARDVSVGSELITPTTSRRAAFRRFLLVQESFQNKIAILNESTSDIKIYFYNIEDRAFVRSLDTIKLCHSSSASTPPNLIHRHAWKVFECTETFRTRFCMRVKSASPQVSLELSYCTVFPSEALVVRDPLVSLSC